MVETRSQTRRRNEYITTIKDMLATIENTDDQHFRIELTRILYVYFMNKHIYNELILRYPQFHRTIDDKAKEYVNKPYITFALHTTLCDWLKNYSLSIH